LKRGNPFGGNGLGSKLRAGRKKKPEKVIKKRKVLGEGF